MFLNVRGISPPASYMYARIQVIYIRDIYSVASGMRMRTCLTGWSRDEGLAMCLAIMAAAAMCKCSNLFKDPRMLPCLHTFCLQCLLKASEIQGAKESLKCPTCDETVALPEGGIEHLPIDLRRAHEAEVARYGKKLEAGEEACGICFRTDSGPAVAFCVNCCEFLCKVCDEHHRSARKTHKHEIVVAGGTLKKEEKESKTVAEKCREPPMPCVIHDDEVLKFFCEQCEKLICRDCMELEHSDHRSQCNRVEAIATRAMESLKTGTVKCQSALASVNETISKCKEIMQQVDSRKKEVDDTISKSLDQIREALHLQNEAIYMGKITNLKTQVCELERMQDDLSHVCDKIVEAESHTPSQQLCARRIISDRTDQLLQRYNNSHAIPLESPLFVTKLADQGTVSEMIDLCQISSGSDAASSTCNVGYIPRAVVGKERTIKVTARSKDGSCFPHGHEAVTAKLALMGSDKNVVHGTSVDHGDGTYSFSFTPHSVGEHKVQVEIGGHPIRGSPYVLTVRQPRATPYAALSSQKVLYTNQTPWDIAFTENGILAVAEKDNHTVSLYSTDGNRLHTFGVGGTSGSGANRFYSPSAVAISGDVMYVTEYSNHRVKKIRLSSKTTITKFGSSGGGDVQFSSPRGICIDPEGKLFIADYSNHRIQVFQADGTFAYSITADPQNEESQFQSPWGLAFDLQGRLHIAAYSSNCIKVYTPEGTFVKSYGSGTVTRPAGIAIDEEGYIAISQYRSNGRVWIYSPDHTEPPVNTIRNVHHPVGIACDAEGTFWIADSGNNRVMQY